jgi:hypothetical protein
MSERVDRTQLERARMSLAQAITRSMDAADVSDRLAAEDHHLAAEMSLRRAGREDLGFRLSVIPDEAEITDAEAREQMREVCQLIDAEIEPAVASRHGFEPASAISTDGGES